MRHPRAVTEDSSRNGGTPRVLGFWICLALVVGNMVGSGIFMLPAALAPFGWNAALGWGFTIAGSLCLALVFARLARHLPQDGGPYAYSRRAFGRGAAFALAWSYWISIWVANAAIAVAAISYLSLFFPVLGEAPAVAAGATLALLWTLTLLNCASLRAAGGFQLVTALIKLLPLLLAILLGAWLLGARGTEAVAAAPEPLGFAATSAAAALTLWAMLGFESATIPAGSVRDPERTIPRATLIGTLIVGLLYLLASSAVSLLMPAAALAGSSAPFADFIGGFLGREAALLVAACAAVSMVGALNGWVLLQGQVPLAMARDGAFPAWLGATGPGGTPVRALTLSSLLASILVVANYSRTLAELFAFMALLATVAALILYLICAAAALKLMRTGEMPRSRSLAILAILGAFYALWTLFGAGMEATAWGTVLLASGIPVYALMARNRGRRPAVEGPEDGMRHG